MAKITMVDVQEAYNDIETAETYVESVDSVGLWESEKWIFETYANKNSSILDIGCGAGRTTFGLHQIGYHKIIGLDISQEMVMQAQKLNEKKGLQISFLCKDAQSLPYESNEFDIVFFSFNGLMQVPTKQLRENVGLEIKRVLKAGGLFIFTTHDRKHPEHKRLWASELNIWSQNMQDKRLHEFGDLIIQRKGKETYLHIPTQNEIIDLMGKIGFDILLAKDRSDIKIENESVKKVASECVFWVVKK